MINTTEQNAVRYIVFKEDDVWIAVALEAGLVEEGDTPDEALFGLFGAITAHFEVRSDPRFEGKTFFQPPVDPEYEALWEQAQQSFRGVASPYTIYTSGVRQVAA
jgi:hypothetical protein